MAVTMAVTGYNLELMNTISILVLTYLHTYTHIKTHDSESRGQEEAQQHNH